jgi:hypothetical protein
MCVASKTRACMTGTLFELMNTVDKHSEDMTDAAYRDICERMLDVWKARPVKIVPPSGGLHYGSSEQPTSSSRALNKSLELVNKKIQVLIEEVVKPDITPDAERNLRNEIRSLQENRESLIFMLEDK